MQTYRPSKWQCRLIPYKARSYKNVILREKKLYLIIKYRRSKTPTKIKAQLRSSDGVVVIITSRHWVAFSVCSQHTHPILCDRSARSIHAHHHLYVVTQHLPHLYSRITRTPWLKKHYIWLLIITSANVDRLSKFFHCQNPKKTTYVTIIGSSISP